MLRDLVREALIRYYKLRMLLCQDANRGFWWKRMRAEISRRSPQQVERMERRMGLR